MGKIPRYNAEGSPKAGQIVAEGLAKAGQALFDIGEKFQKVRQEEEIGRATVQATQNLNDIETEAIQDTEVIGWDEKYDKKLTELRGNISKGFRDREAQAEFLRRFDIDLVNQQQKIKQYGYKKLVDQRLTTLSEESSQLQDIYLKEENPSLKQQHLSKIAFLFNTAAKDGVMSAKDASENFIKIKEELPEQQAKADILQDPSFALGQLQKGNQGVYKDLASDKRSSLIKEAETRLEKVQKQEEERVAIAQNEGEAELIDLRSAGTLTEKVVNQYEAMGKSSPKFAETMRQNLRSPKIIGAKTHDAAFKKIVEDMIDPAKNPKDIRIDILKNETSGNLSKDSSNALTVFNQNMTKETIDTTLPKQKHLWGLIQWGTDSNLRPEAKSRMLLNYIQMVNTGEEPTIALKKAIRKETLLNHPQAAGYSEKGKKIMDISGVFKKIFPTGDIEDTGDAD